MCGIFAWSGLKPGQFNKHKFDITGIWNETRGEHSCGVTAEGLIRVGVKDLKVYRDFVAGADFIPRPRKIPAMIGHTRHATVGDHSEFNAHPFGFGGEGDVYEFVGVHNGSLLNHIELAEEFEIDVEVGEGRDSRRKIDSEILLEILYKTRNYKVLSKYNGAAALIWQFLEEPDVMYFYHGMSKLYPLTQTASEERPLYYYKEGKRSLYVSSIEDSLRAIGATDSTVGEFDFNTVYRVVNGNIDEATKTKVSRSTNYQRRTTSVTNYHGYNTQEGGRRAAVPYEYVAPRVAFAQNAAKASNGTNASVSTTPNIYKELPYIDVNQYEGRVYLHKLRYWRNGHRINGIWTLVKGYGFYFLGMNPQDAEKQFWEYTNKLFFNGGFYNPSQLKTIEIAKSITPFPHGGKHKEITHPPMFNFYDGIILEHYLDFAAAIGREKAANPFSIREISQMSRHPIMDLTFAHRGSTEQGVFYKGKLANATYCPLESSRLYTFEAGNLTKVQDLINPTKIVNNLPEVVDTIDVEFQEVDPIDLNDLESEINAQETALTVVKDEKTLFIDNDLLEADITNIFSSSFDDFLDFKKELGKYGSNPRALQAAAILTTFVNAAYQLLTVEPKQ